MGSSGNGKWLDNYFLIEFGKKNNEDYGLDLLLLVIDDDAIRAVRKAIAAKVILLAWEVQ